MCVESSALDVHCIDTYHRLAKMDGRYIHWVNGYEGERYSVIFYRTRGVRVPVGKAVFVNT